MWAYFYISSNGEKNKTLFASIVNSNQLNMSDGLAVQASTIHSRKYFHQICSPSGSEALHKETRSTDKTLKVRNHVKINNINSAPQDAFVLSY